MIPKLQFSDLENSTMRFSICSYKPLQCSATTIFIEQTLLICVEYWWASEERQTFKIMKNCNGWEMSRKRVDPLYLSMGRDVCKWIVRNNYSGKRFDLLNEYPLTNVEQINSLTGMKFTSWKWKFSIRGCFVLWNRSPDVQVGYDFQIGRYCHPIRVTSNILGGKKKRKHSYSAAKWKIFQSKKDVHGINDSLCRCSMSWSWQAFILWNITVQMCDPFGSFEQFKGDEVSTWCEQFWWEHSSLRTRANEE